MTSSLKMECAVPWQRFEPTRCILGQRQQNKRHQSAEYIPVSYKDSLLELAAFQVITPWLGKPDNFIMTDSCELTWSITDLTFFQKLKILHEHLRVNLLTNHRVKLNTSSFLFTVFLEEDKVIATDINSNAQIQLTENILREAGNSYRLCVRLAGIHLQYGIANYRFKCVSMRIKRPQPN